MPHPTRFALVLAIAGCSAPQPDSVQKDGLPPATPPSPGAPTAERPRSEPRAASETVVGASPAATLALDGEGLRIFAVPSGASRLWPFGSSRPDTLRTLEAVRGGAPARLGENVDCGASTATWPDGLTVWFSRERFVGWSLASDGSPLTTAGGLRVGATRADLVGGATVARIKPSSIGEEFTAGDIGGLLDSAGATGKVTHLWAGATCIAR